MNILEQLRKAYISIKTRLCNEDSCLDRTYYVSSVTTHFYPETTQRSNTPEEKAERIIDFCKRRADSKGLKTLLIGPVIFCE